MEMEPQKEQHVKGGIYQKDQFHIVRNNKRCTKEYRNIIIELINKKNLSKSNQRLMV